MCDIHGDKRLANVFFSVHTAFFYDGSLYFDANCTNQIPGPLYGLEGDPNYYLDSELTERVSIIVIPEVTQQQTIDQTEQQVAGDEMLKHEIWTGNETKFLISSITDFVKENDVLPKSITELERRIKFGKGNKKNMWIEIAQALTFKFELVFDAKRVARKWQTLSDGYKKALDNNNKTGQGPSRFQWMSEMDELLGERHDVRPVLTATSEGLVIHRPAELSPSEIPQAGNSPNDSSMSDATVNDDPIFKTPTTSGEFEGKGKARKRKRTESDSDIDKMLQYMKESDLRAEESEKKLLDEIF